MSHNKSKIALAVGIGIWGMQAQAFEIDTGPNVTTSLESVAEFTSVYRTSSPERIERGGQNIFANNNDGSEYYDTGFVSNEFKLTSELHVRTEQDGLFVRGTAWYDTQIMDNDPSGDRFATHNTDSDERYPSDLRNRAGHRARLLDAYLYTNRYIGVQLSVPLYAGGYVNASVRAALAQQEQANELLEAGRRDLELRIHSEFRNVSEGRMRIRALEQAARSANQLAHSSRKSFEGGARTLVDVLNADQQAARAMRDLARARYLYLLSCIRLQSLAGEEQDAGITAVNALLTPP